MLPEFQINLHDIRLANLNERRLGINFLLLDNFDDTMLSSKQILDDLQVNQREVFRSGLFINYSDKHYFPLLLNYLAIIDIQNIRECLEVHVKQLDKKRFMEFLAFITKYLSPIFSQYKLSIGGINAKKLAIDDWVNRYHHKETKTELPISSTIFFDISEQKIDKIIDSLQKDKVIDDESRIILKQYFNNDFSQVLKLKASKNQVVDLFRSEISGSQKNQFFWKELASKLGKLWAFDKDEYCQIKHNYLVRLLSDGSKTPKRPLIRI